MRYAICSRRDGDAPVISGLCYTPAQMYDAASRGVPIASRQVPDEHFTEGDTDYSPHVDIEYRRGIDINDLWNESQNVRSKMRNAYKEAVQLSKINTSV